MKLLLNLRIYLGMKNKSK